MSSFLGHSVAGLTVYLTTTELQPILQDRAISLAMSRRFKF